MTDRARITHRTAIACWFLLVASVACWPIGGSAIGWPTTAFAFLPLMLPIAGLLRGLRRTYGWAPLALAPVLALALTEVLIDDTARARAGLSLALIFLAFASVIAALRTAPRE
ncbi:MAG: DUF2069 domain-containing protein [Steroidobacteraceae bacterium]